MLSFYPDKLMMMLNLTYLPAANGVFRITAPHRWQLDVFDRKEPTSTLWFFPTGF
jgi:hypothetical protein